MEFLLIGIATAFNILILKAKLERKRYEDAALDAGVLIGLSIVFGGSYGGLVVATISSAIVSLYLLKNPPHLFTFSKDNTTIKEFVEEFKKRARRP